MRLKTLGYFNQNEATASVFRVDEDGGTASAGKIVNTKHEDITQNCLLREDLKSYSLYTAPVAQVFPLF
jgi:hypothetical protein